MRLALLLLLATSASAQSPADATEAGRIVGVVTDAETGEPLIGASIRLVGTERGTATDVNGTFEVDRVPEGTYDVAIAYVGFDVATVRGITVHSEEAVALRSSLRAAVLCECVIVCTGPETVSRGVYQARVVSYQHWESECCSVWLERSAVPTQHWETR